MKASHLLPPFPSGWFALGFSEELVGTRRFQWMGRDVRAERDARGELRARDAQGTPIVLDEQQGVVLGWSHASEREPSWRVPTPDATGWTAYRGHCWRGLDSHPQETSENSVDVAHFSKVHSYRNVRTLRSAEPIGPCLEAEYHFTRSMLRRGPRRPETHTDFIVQVWGLGFSFVETHVHKLGIKTRQLVMATPIDGERIDLRISAAVWGFEGFGPLGSVGRFLTRAGLMRAYIGDVSDDFDIWQNKRYLDRPIVVEGDGPAPPAPEARHRDGLDCIHTWLCLRQPSRSGHGIDRGG